MAGRGKNSLFLVPEGKGNVHAAVSVGNTSNAILAPAESPGASHVVGEMTPSVAIVAVVCQCGSQFGDLNKDSRVVLADSGPLPLGDIGTHVLPVLDTVIVLLEPALLDAGDVVLVDDNHCERLAASAAAGLVDGAVYERGL